MNEADIFTVMHNKDVVLSLNIALVIGILTCIALIGIFVMLIKINKNLKKNK